MKLVKNSLLQLNYQVYKKEQIQIEIQSEYLKVSVKEEILEEEEEQTSHNYYRRERSISEASRLIKLPYSINKKSGKKLLIKTAY